VLRDQLIAEISGLKAADDLALWAHRRLPAKNTLTAGDAGAVETAFLAMLSASAAVTPDPGPEPGVETQPVKPVNGPAAKAAPTPVPELIVAPKPARARNKAHLRFVAAQPCLVCQRSPCDAHHLKFAQPRALGRKVSDEYVVPLCRDHHRQLHRYGNEIAWWANIQAAPLEIARNLWESTLLGDDSQTGAARPAVRDGPLGADNK